jgi:hypothetical protein
LKESNAQKSNDKLSPKQEFVKKSTQKLSAIMSMEDLDYTLQQSRLLISALNKSLKNTSNLAKVHTFLIFGVTGNLGFPPKKSHMAPLGILDTLISTFVINAVVTFTVLELNVATKDTKVLNIDMLLAHLQSGVGAGGQNPDVRAERNVLEANKPAVHFTTLWNQSLEKWSPGQKLCIVPNQKKLLRLNQFVNLVANYQFTLTNTSALTKLI